MPVEQRDPRQTFRAVALGVAAVAAAVGFLIFVLWATDRGGVEIALGDDVFEAGRADIIADQIADGGPIRYADLLGGGQNIILQHVGSDPETGWFAFDLIRPGQGPECQLEWQADSFVFTDPCDDTVQVPAGGGDQPSYPVTVTDEGRLQVDFRLEPAEPTDG
ncbi:MAG: hypothetical protein AAF567_23800 [Actinomycetota bacterium]